MLETVIYNQGNYTTPSLLVLGCFDALHIGHRELLKKAKLQAKINGLDLGVMIFRDGKGGDTILTLDERIKILESYNVKFILLIDYNDEFKKTTAAQFLQVLDNQLNLKGIMSGKDFRFGAGAKGKSSTLKNYADDEENGVWYMSVKDVTDGGAKISTSGIKELLQNGDIVKADELLGSCFSVSGEVVHGAGRGGEVIGFPTVNITYPENKIKIKQGVYKVKSTIDGVEYQGIANYGARPTFGENDCVLEVNYEGFSGDVYGQVLTVEFVDYIRDIQTFDDAEQLAEQLEKDKQCVEEEHSSEQSETSEEVVEQPVDQTGEMPEEVIEQPSELDEISEEETEQPIEQSEAIEETIEQLIEQSEVTEEVIEQLIEQSEVTEEVIEQPIEQSGETPEISEEYTEESSKEVIEQSTEQEEIPAEQSEEASEEINGQDEEQVTENTEDKND